MTVSTPYDYVDGRTLVPAEHNRNIYDSTPGVGIMSEANGGLGPANLDSSFKVRDDHVWPGEVFRGTQEAMLDSTDYFSDAFSDVSLSSTTAVSVGDFRPVIGCSARIYVPYNVTLALWEWSFFFSAYRILVESDEAELNGRAYDMFVQARLDGSLLDHTRRGIPFSTLLGIEGNPGSRKVEERKELTAAGATRTFDSTRREPAVAMQWDMNHMAKDVSSGWHSLDLTLYMSPVIDPSGDENEGILTAEQERKVGAASKAKFDHKFYQRFTLGVRNARVLTIL